MSPGNRTTKTGLFIPFSSASREVCAVTIVLALSAVSLIATGCGGSGSRANPTKAAPGGSAETTVLAVTTTKAIAREVPTYIQATGSLIADETSDVSSPVSGQVVSTPVNVGAYVRQGAVIAQLNNRDARLRLQEAQAGVRQAIAGVRQAEARLGLRPGGNFDASSIPEVRAASATFDQAVAQLRLAEANEARYRDLVVTGDVAQTVYDQYRTQRDTARAQVNNARQQLEATVNTARQSNQAIRTAEANVDSARAQVAIAQKAVADATIHSPYGGYISNRPIAVGEFVTSSSVIATVLRTNPIKLQLLVQEAEAPHIHPGMGVSLEVDAHRDRKFAGTVTAVNPAIDPISRAATVEVAVENGDNALRSGMFATGKIVRKGGGAAVFVPRSAVFSDQNTQSYRAFVIEGDIAKLRVLQLGPEEGDMLQIVSGINEGEVLATSNLAQLYEGARVQVE
ncbi:MAG: efflux RND transporter periplasmic adaptor subunit [Pyrinomonadaceae bacterium]